MNIILHCTAFGNAFGSGASTELHGMELARERAVQFVRVADGSCSGDSNRKRQPFDAWIMLWCMRTTSTPCRQRSCRKCRRWAADASVFQTNRHANFQAFDLHIMSLICTQNLNDHDHDHDHEHCGRWSALAQSISTDDTLIHRHKHSFTGLNPSKVQDDCCCPNTRCRLLWPSFLR